jgi:hypothetical protein
MKKTASRSTALAIKHALARRAPIVKPIIVKPAAIVVKKTKHKKHRGGGVSGLVGGFLSGHRTELALGALGVGFLEKQNMLSNLPALPIVGRKGTIALAAHFISGGKPGLASSICTAALVLAAHEFGQTGSISGTDGYVAGGGVDYVAGF